MGKKYIVKENKIIKSYFVLLTGRLCETDKLTLCQCENNGSCINNGSTMECKCPSGYGGNH